MIEASATGSTVESLSRLTNQAKIAGSDLATVENALLKLSKGMAGTDAESTKTKEALKLLGITTRDPVQALEEASVALSKFRDGVNKVGLVAALFNTKDGQQYIKIMQDIANLQDVAATKTTQQAADAKKLEEAFGRLSVAATGFANTLLSNISGITDWVNELRIGIEVAGGFFNALNTLSRVDLGQPLATQIRNIDDAITKLQSNLHEDGGFLAGLDNKLIQRHIDNLKTQRAFIEAIMKQRQELGRSFRQAPGATDKPEAPFIPAAGGGKGAKEAKDATDQFVKSLEQQLQATLDLSAEDLILIKLYDLQHDGISKVDEATKEYVRDIAKQVQASVDAKKAADDARRAAEEDARVRDHIAQTLLRLVEAEQREAEQIKAGNEQIREQIAFLTGGEEAYRKLTDAKTADTLAEKERLLAVIAGGEGQEAETAALQESIRLLKERQAVLKEFDVAKKFAEEKKALDDFKNAVGDTFANAFEGFITGTKSAKDAFKSFVADIESALVKLALKKLMNKILGVSDTGGPDIFDIAAKFLGLWAGSGTSTGGVPGVGFSGGGFGEHFATGGVSRGGLAMVGEQGPEIVALPRGARVIPINRSKTGSSISQTFNINVLPGATNASVRQAKAQLRDAVMSSMRDR